MNERLKDSARLEQPRPPLPGDELSDEELEAVVGGLTRPWVQPLLPMHVGLDPL
jgi:bacteriocin-like protein